MPARNISHALTFSAITPKAKIDLQWKKCVKQNNTKYKIQYSDYHCYSLSFSFTAGFASVGDPTMHNTFFV